MAWLAKMFKLRENKTTVATEVRAGVATCVSSAIATLLMAFFANYPIALAPAMGHNFLKLVTGRGREVHWLVYLFSVLFIARYVYVGT